MDDLILTVRARRLLKEVKRLRTEAGLKVLRAAKKLGIAESTLWRMENGHSRLTMEVLVAMLDLYGVPSPEREALERLGIDSVRRGWWAPYADVFSGSYVALETDASLIRVNAFVIPGFFQTEEYTHAAIANTGLKYNAGEVERRKAARFARQKALFEDRDEPPAIHLLLDESVVHRQVGGPTAMRGQLERLAEVAAWPSVTLQVTPFTAGIHAGMNGEFLIIDFPDPQDDPFVFEEGLAGDLYLEDPKSLARYSLAFDRVKDVALSPERSVDLINRLAKEQE